MGVKIRPGDVVYLRWVDSQGYCEGWSEYEAQSMEIRSAGLVIHNDDDRIVLAQSQSLNPYAVPYDHIIEIPWVSVMKAKRLQKGPKQ